MNLVSESTFHAALSLVTAGAAGFWLVHDLVSLVRLRRAPKGDPLVNDQRFGYGIGVVIGAIGVVGTLRFNGWL